MSECFSVRFSSSTTSSLRPPLTTGANDADLEAQETLSWKALTLLASTAITFAPLGSHVPSCSFESQEPAGSFHQGEEEGYFQQGRHVRRDSYGALRSQKSKDSGTTMPWSARTGPGIQGIGHGLQWPCQVGRLREVPPPPPPVVHASVRGDWTSPTGRSIAGGHEAPDRGAWREGSLQSLVEHSGSGPGRSRAFLADQARSHPCSQGGDWVLCSPDSQHQRDLESGNTNGNRESFPYGRGGTLTGAWEQIPSDLAAEQAEYEDRSHRSWSPVSPPSGGGEARSV